MDTGIDINNDYRNITEWLGSHHNIRTGQELADAGIPVFPCNEDKTPATAHGFKDATTDPDRIKIFFRPRNRVIGMPTGAASGMSALDEDTHKGGDLRTLGDIPIKVVARTRSGGRHVFF